MEVSGTTFGTSTKLAKNGAEPLLGVRDLTVRILVDRNVDICPVNGVDFQIHAGEVVGLLGESGAGKTTLALALMCLLPPAGRYVRGSIAFAGHQLLSMSERELLKIRGARMSLIHQDSSVLNPVLRVGDQVVEVLRAHRSWTKSRCREEARQLLRDVELGDVDRIYRAYPHQLSGGQCQRIVIAQAIACRPALVIADEPTASLDTETDSGIIDLLQRLTRRFDTAFLLISHDVAILSRLADRIMVMYAGRIVEQGARDEVLREPLHPYTRALLQCVAQEDKLEALARGRHPVPTIPGSPPDLTRTGFACDFKERCPDRMDVCTTRVPPDSQASGTHRVACFKFGAETC